jgi:hypothetical protein
MKNQKKLQANKRVNNSNESEIQCEIENVISSEANFEQKSDDDQQVQSNLTPSAPHTNINHVSNDNDSISAMDVDDHVSMLSATEATQSVDDAVNAVKQLILLSRNRSNSSSSMHSNNGNSSESARVVPSFSNSSKICGKRSYTACESDSSNQTTKRPRLSADVVVTPQCSSSYQSSSYNNGVTGAVPERVLSWFSRIATWPTTLHQFVSTAFGMTSQSSTPRTAEQHTYHPMHNQINNVQNVAAY